MKKLIAPLLLLLVLTGCGEDEPTYEDNGLSEAEREEIFVDYMKSTYPEDYAYVEDALMVEGAEELCGALDRGASIREVGAVGTKVGFSPEGSGAFVGGAVTAFCPEYGYMIDALEY